MMYSGNTRIGTGLGFLNAYTELMKTAEEFDTRRSAESSQLQDLTDDLAAVRIAHGDADKQTSHSASQEFIERAGSVDKSIVIHEGYEHVLVKVSLVQYLCGVC